LESAAVKFSPTSKKQIRTGVADTGISIPTQMSNKAASILRTSQTVTAMNRTGQELIRAGKAHQNASPATAAQPFPETSV
jgi:hypothetical protein